MKSLERRFNKISDKKPFWSSYIHFAEAVKEQNFSRPIIHRWFNKLVDKDDYVKNEKRAILEHLENISNCLRKTEMGVKSSQRKVFAQT